MTTKPRLHSARFFNVLFGRVVRWLVREKVLPEDPEFERDKPVCYMLETDALSSIVILQQVCGARGLPMPLDELPVESEHPMRSTVPIKRLRGVFSRRTDLRTHLKQIAAMAEAVDSGRCSDIQLVPVSIFLGRAPDKEMGVWRVLLSENWPVAGRFRRALSVLIHGRSTLVQFSAPISMRAQVEEGLTRDRIARKISRVLRVHFRRVRTAAIGPDLSHRRTLVDGIVRSPQVREAIFQAANRNDQSIARVRRQARQYATEIAADYSYPFVQIMYRLLTWFWNRIYAGVKVHHLENLTGVTEGTEIVYVPCHRSHMDYLLLSYLVYDNGIAIPHIAAGVNLNLPVVGPFLRRGGAFFLRRSFRANPLYSAVFNEYVETIFAKGVPMEYFIEGTRSRTGRLLQPRTGMIAMTVRSYLKHPQRPTVFVPVYIGYERLVEGGAYLGELSGGKKKRETLAGLLSSYKILKEQYGEVHVAFGRPIRLEAHLDGCHPLWREHASDAAEKPAWLSDCVDRLAYRILTEVNGAASVNAVNLVALALLASPKNALAEEDLLAHIELYQDLMRTLPYSGAMTLADLEPAEVVAHAEKLGVLRRRAHELGDLLSCDERDSFLLSYFRNNVVHATVVYSWCASVFRNNTTFPRRELARLGRVIYPFLRGELFLHWSLEEFSEQCERCVSLFEERGLLVDSGDPGLLQRAPGGSVNALHLRLLGESVFASLERYYMVLTILTRHGPGTLTASDLENLCHLTAQRLSMLYTLETPDYFDKHLFRHFIRRLKDRNVLTVDAEGRLGFEQNLKAVLEDAKLILGKDIRHSIMQVTPERVAGPDRDAA